MQAKGISRIPSMHARYVSARTQSSSNFRISSSSDGASVGFADAASNTAMDKQRIRLK
jgi:hypothetical protein